MTQILGRCKKLASSFLFSPFTCAFIVWVILFWGFLTGRLAFLEDATSYLNQTEYLTNGFLKGIFPIWNHASFGIPNDFFLLRLGAFNPFYILITLCRVVGIPFLFAYAWGTALYYFLGCCGFYLICKRLTGDRLASFVGFLLLYFSALGTRIFDSFIILVFVPLIWFFFFLVDFFQKPTRKSFLGMVFSTMILLSTYVPFYFLLIFLVFLLFSLFVFPLSFLKNLKTFFMFIAKERIVFSLGVVAIIIALIPGVLFFQAAHRGDYAMARRHYQAEGAAAVEVDINKSKSWAIIEDIAYSSSFTDFRRMKFAIFYIPIMAWLILSLGIIVPFSRKMLFYLLFAGFFLVLGVPRVFPLYSFLHQHVFFFKYFRNLHFFLWWIILPVFILLLVEQLKSLLAFKEKSGRFWAVPFIGLVHFLWFLFVINQPEKIWMSIVAIVFSCLFFMLYIAGKLNHVSWRVVALISLIVIAAQPSEVYRYLGNNSVVKEELYQYERNPGLFSYSRKLEITPGDQSRLEFYIALSDMQDLAFNIEASVFQHYVDKKIIVYDHVEILEEDFDWSVVEQALRDFKNKAFVESWDQKNILDQSLNSALVISGPDQGVEFVEYESNHFLLKTEFERPKFLVVSDAFHPNWKSWIDGKEVDIYKANMAFKGVYVPAGKHQIVFKYDYFLWMRYLGVLVFCSIFIAVIFGYFRSQDGRDD